MRTLGYNVEDSEGEQLLMGLDVNHDGSVTFDEFAACLLDWKQVCSWHHNHSCACPHMPYCVVVAVP